VRVRDLFRLAAEAQWGHVLRTTLTLTAIAIGVTAVIVLTSLGEAAKQYVVDQFASLGSNLVIVLPGKVETTGLPTFGGATRDLTIDDAEAVLRQAPVVRQVAPRSMGSARFSYQALHRDVRVIGTTAEFKDIRSMSMRVGQFLPRGDPRHGDPVVVIGPRIHEEVFAGQNPVGKSVRIGDWRFRVIGVVESKGNFLGINFDDMAMVPVSTGLKLFDQTSLFRIFTQVGSAEDVPAAISQIKRVLIERHDGNEDFTLITQDAMLATFRSVIDALTAALAGIAAISLGVAGIGIMNVMLVSVSERSAEVGLLKALGARRRQILRVFLVEALLLSGAGAAIGILAGTTLVLVAAALFPDFPLHPSGTWIGVVLGLALAAGVAFGLMPARRAAALEPADALRGSHG
jgi:putative ABC transport system permease protein